MMNSLLAYNLGGVEMSCHRCKREFKSYRIFENHLKAHQDVAKLQRYNQNGSNSAQISIDSTSSNLSLLSTTGNSFGHLGNNPLVSTAAKSLDIMSPNLSSASNNIASSTPLAPIGYHRNPDYLFKDSSIQHKLEMKKFPSMKEPTIVRNFLLKDAKSAFPTSGIMNDAQGKYKGKVGQKEYTHSCYYCNKVFNDYHALGGHLRAHQEEIKIRRNQNYAGPSRNPIDGTTSNPILSMNSLDKTSSTFLIKDPSLSKGIYSENSINGDPNIQLTLSPNYSYARNKMKASSTSCVRRTLPSTLPMDSPSYMVSYGIPLGQSPNISSTGIHQFSYVVGSHSFPNGRLLTNTRHHNQNNLPYLIRPPCSSYQMNGFNQGIDSNKFRSSPYDHSTNLACKRAGEQWLRVQGDEITASSSKRSKINFIPPVFHETKMPKKKGSLLVKDANLGKDKSAACDNADDHARENCEAKLDLSLHL